MTALRLEGQTWWFKEENEELDTQAVLLRFLAGEIDPSSLCRNEEDPDWKSIKQRFQLLGPYAVLRKLGEGAFGIVYLGVHRDALKSSGPTSFAALKSPTEALLDRFINAAKKNENPELSATENREALRTWAKLQLGELFSKEAALTARFAQCPHVVNVLDHNISTPYLALEFCNEGSLADRIRKPYDWDEVLSWSLQLAKALTVAHSLNPRIVHRDLKPDNVLIHNSQLKLADLGTSQLLQNTESLRSLRGGFTPSYAAPEAFDAKAYPETDIWSFGVMLYEFVSGELPFKGQSMASLMKAITTSEAKGIKNGGEVKAPDQFIELIHDCLKKEVRERPSAQECLTRLTALENGHGATIQTEGTEGTDCTEDNGVDRGHRDFMIAASILVLAIAVTAILIYLAQSSTPLNEIEREPKESPKISLKIEVLSRAKKRGLLRDVKGWDQASSEAQDQAIQYALKLLGPSFILDKVQFYECNGVKHRIARLIHRSTGLPFQLIPGGQFQMGDGEHPAEPVHTVTIRRPFLISPTELSQRQWEELGGKNNAVGIRRKPELPIHSLSREDALEIISKFGFRLPSESEWEYACRAGSATKYFWGESASKQYSWNSNNKDSKGNFRNMMPVFEHLRAGDWNAFGLCDMPGNVWEYCSDHWMNSYGSGPVDERARVYASENERSIEDGKLAKVRRGRGSMRGGSFYGPVTNGQSANRNCDEWQSDAVKASFKVGLRLCVTIDGFPVPTKH